MTGERKRARPARRLLVRGCNVGDFELWRLWLIVGHDHVELRRYGRRKHTSVRLTLGEAASVLWRYHQRRECERAWGEPERPSSGRPRQVSLPLRERAG